MEIRQGLFLEKDPDRTARFRRWVGPCTAQATSRSCTLEGRNGDAMRWDDAQEQSDDARERCDDVAGCRSGEVVRFDHAAVHSSGETVLKLCEAVR